MINKCKYSYMLNICQRIEGFLRVKRGVKIKQSKLSCFATNIDIEIKLQFEVFKSPLLHKMYIFDIRDNFL